MVFISLLNPLLSGFLREKHLAKKQQLVSENHLMLLRTPEHVETFQTHLVSGQDV